MKKLKREEIKTLQGGTNPVFEDGACCKTGDYCNSGQKCCDSTKGYQGKCPSQESAKCD